MNRLSLLESEQLSPGEPLWQRVPVRDEHGQLLNDFMMLIPKLRHWPDPKRQKTLQELRKVLSSFDGRVVFADLNLKLNLLWISLRPHPEGSIAVAAAIKAAVPEAVLVASQYEALIGMAGGGGSRNRRNWLALRQSLYGRLLGKAGA